MQRSESELFSIRKEKFVSFKKFKARLWFCRWSSTDNYGERYHYVLITDRVNLVRKLHGRQIDARSKICRNFLNNRSNNETLQKHEKFCY